MLGLGGVAPVLMLSVTVDVVARYIRHPVAGNIEVAELLLIPAAFFAMAATHLNRGHVRVEILHSRLPTRVQGIMDSFTLLLSTGIFGLIIWAMANRVGRIIASPGLGPVSDLLGIPKFPLLIVIIIGLILLCLVLLIDLVYAVARASGKHNG